MKRNLLRIFIIVLIFEFFFGPLRDWLLDGDFKAAFMDNFDSGHSISLYFNYLVIGFCYAATSYLVFTKFHPSKSYTEAIPILAISLLAIVFFRYFLDEILTFNLFGHGNYNPGFSWTYYIADNLYYLIIFSLVGAVTYFIQYAMHKEQQTNELLLNNKKAELEFLKSQINPHFLFNSMNNLYSLVYQKSDHALDVVSKLSGMLRYSLYENAEKITLDKELQYINDFIDLEKLRNDFKLQINFQIEKGLESISIPPFLLIPFIENAFKHGDLKNEAKPVNIEIRKQDRDFIFQISNQKIQQQKDHVGGIGLKNVKKRLALLFPETHALRIDENDNSFDVHLKIEDLC